MGGGVTLINVLFLVLFKAQLLPTIVVISSAPFAGDNKKKSPPLRVNKKKKPIGSWAGKN